MFSLIRLIIRLIINRRTRRWVFLTAGIGLIIIGIIVGAESHQITYNKIEKATLIHYLYFPSNDDDSAYIQLSDGSMYVARQNDFTPQLSSDQLQSNTVSLVYDPTDTTHIDKATDDGKTHLVGEGANIAQLTIFDQNGGNPRVFATSDYTDNPQGFYKNNWPLGMMLIIGGLVVAGLSLLLPMLLMARQANKSAVPSYQAGVPLNNQPYGAPQDAPAPYNPYNYEQTPPDPYQQPYQGPAPYQPYQSQVEPTMPAQAPQVEYPPTQRADQPYQG